MKTMTTTQKKRASVLAAIALTALIAVMLAAVSCSAESDDGIELTDAVLSNQATEEIAADINLDGKAETDMPKQENVQENVDSSEADSANPETASTADDQSQATQQHAQRLTGSDPNAPASASSGSLSDPAPSKRWVEDTQQVWVEDRAAWTEQVPVYSTREVSICNVCGQDITGSTSAHAKAHMMVGEGSGHHGEVRQTVTGYNSVNHPAEGHWETRVAGGHWE